MPQDPVKKGKAPELKIGAVNPMLRNFTQAVSPQDPIFLNSGQIPPIITNQEPLYDELDTSTKPKNIYVDQGGGKWDAPVVHNQSSGIAAALAGKKINELMSSGEEGGGKEKQLESDQERLTKMKQKFELQEQFGVSATPEIGSEYLDTFNTINEGQSPLDERDSIFMRGNELRGQLDALLNEAGKLGERLSSGEIDLTEQRGQPTVIDGLLSRYGIPFTGGGPTEGERTVRAFGQMLDAAGQLQHMATTADRAAMNRSQYLESVADKSRQRDDMDKAFSSNAVAVSQRHAVQSAQAYFQTLTADGSDPLPDGSNVVELQKPIEHQWSNIMRDTMVDFAATANGSKEEQDAFHSSLMQRLGAASMFEGGTKDFAASKEEFATHFSAILGEYGLMPKNYRDALNTPAFTADRIRLQGNLLDVSKAHGKFMSDYSKAVERAYDQLIRDMPTEESFFEKALGVVIGIQKPGTLREDIKRGVQQFKKDPQKIYSRGVKGIAERAVDRRKKQQQ